MHFSDIIFSGCTMTYFSFTKVTFVNILEATSLFNAQKRTFWVKGHTSNHSLECTGTDVFWLNVSFGADTH